MTGPTNGGIEVEGYGAKVKAQGRGALILFGFLVMAGAIIYNGMQEREARTSQTKLLTAIFDNQKDFIEGYVNRAGADHIEIKAACIRERLFGAPPARPRQRESAEP